MQCVARSHKCEVQDETPLVRSSAVLIISLSLPHSTLQSLNPLRPPYPQQPLRRRTWHLSALSSAIHSPAKQALHRSVVEKTSKKLLHPGFGSSPTGKAKGSGGRDVRFRQEGAQIAESLRCGLEERRVEGDGRVDRRVERLTGLDAVIRCDVQQVDRECRNRLVEGVTTCHWDPCGVDRSWDCAVRYASAAGASA